MSYLLQVRAIERDALALLTQAPFLEGRPPTVAEAVAEFDAWLNSESVDHQETPRDRTQWDLDVAMGVRGRG